MAINKLVILGASVMHKVWSSDPNAGSVPTRDGMQTALLAEGVNLPFYSYAASGHTAAQTNAAVDAALADFAGQTNVAFLVHAGGNDFSANGAYSGWTQGQKDDLSDEIDSICSKITTAGHQVILCPLSYREYSYAITDEDDGTKGANEEIYYPLIQTHSLDWWDSVNSLPIMDIYTVGLDNPEVYFSDETNPADPIHPVYPAGIALLQTYFAETLAANATLPAWDGKEAFLCNVCLTDRPPNSNANTTNNGAVTDLVDTYGNVISSSSFALSGFAAAASNQGKGNVTNIELNELHRQVTQHYVYTQTTAAITITLGAAYAGRTGDVYISGARATTDTNRVALFSVGAESGTVDAALDDPESCVIPVTLDGSGAFVINVATNTGSTYAYFSGAMLVLDPLPVTAPDIDSIGTVRIGTGTTITLVEGGLGTNSVTANGVSVPFTIVDDTEITLSSLPDVQAEFNTSIDIVVTNPAGSDTQSVTWLGPVGFSLVTLGTIADGSDIDIGNEGGAWSPALATGGVLVYRPSAIGTGSEGTIDFDISPTGYFVVATDSTEGTYEILFGAQDASDDYAFTSPEAQFLEIVSGNNPPELDTPIPQQSFIAGTAWSFSVAGNFSDPESDDLEFSLVSAPDGIDISPVGLVTPTTSGAGSVYSPAPINITIAASDDFSSTNASATIVLTLVDVGTVSFTPQTNADLETTYSAVWSTTGLPAGARIAFSGGEVSVDGGATYSASSPVHITGAGTLHARNSITTGSAYGEVKSNVMTINGASAAFVVTTSADPVVKSFIPEFLAEYINTSGDKVLLTDVDLDIAVFDAAGVISGNRLYTGTGSIDSNGVLPTVADPSLGNLGDSIEVVYVTDDGSWFLRVRGTVVDGAA